ncbi:DnaA regulatory inactivator Hda [Noviherbaspirillum cavernae]|uniref:DnaA regulatory inactivator Hda n=1 Tax=Noviherbaspirillum cavernae TaxID=2320862 RepID=A0A418X603_9BURK|nr:DnaA regulatory inactivator Hda [Noviherbaspirillum cavernae]RJG07806.1 DnaA regulatory inactivator Hda [Noviherbaspirillum cavernae]
MRQMLLDLGAEKPQTLDTFVTGQNEELLHLLHQYAQRSSVMPQERFVYLWGESGVGKSHLLHALAAADDARYIPANPDPDAYVFTPHIRLYLLDDCERLSPEAQIAAFALFNQVRENGGLLVAAGATAPATLALREDLRTRFGWGLIYQLHGLTDDAKIAALNHAAHARGIVLSPGVLPYLITHFRRDMQSLSAMLDALDRYSLETQRPITLPLLRNLLQLEGETKEQ